MNCSNLYKNILVQEIRYTRYLCEENKSKISKDLKDFDEENKTHDLFKKYKQDYELTNSLESYTELKKILIKRIVFIINKLDKLTRTK